MAKTPKHVVIVGMIEPWDASNKDDDTEVWAINRAYQSQEKVDAIYFFDSIRHFGDELIAEMNETGCRVVTRRKYDELPNSEEFPLDEVISHTGGLEYFACTAAYMMAHACLLGVEKITVVGMYHPHDSLEYMHHKACMEFWVGVASGAGITVNIVGKSQLCKPMPWTSSRYGYVYQFNESLCVQTLACAYRACYGYPIRWSLNPDDLDDGGKTVQQDLERSHHLLSSVISSAQSDHEFFLRQVEDNRRAIAKETVNADSSGN